MRLARGTRCGAYEITDIVGAGGMGEVYRARDSRLGREVAIKVLPETFAHDAARLARFQREAQLLAALNHPNISAIYGLDEQDGMRYLVLEFVPGETLAERFDRGALPLEEALGFAMQLAEALEAAHEKGIVHRDLKPANIKITPEGKVKVLDFGLAKDVAAASATVPEAATITSPAEMTGVGTILGTAAYMSPEQARGKPVDRRADIWAFGCLLFEMLGGRRPFGGETVTDVMAAIVRSEPDWTILPPGTPAATRRLLLRCLQKDPRQRLRDMGDARLEVDEALAGAPEPATETRPARWKRLAPWAVAAVGCAVAGIAFWGPRRGVDAPPRAAARALIPLPAKTNVVLGRGSSIALSPDGLRLAYVAAAAGGPPQLYLRLLDQFESAPIPGTEGAANPFFSPDSQWIGFFADRKLKKVAVRGGAPLDVADAPNARGEAWLDNDTIVFTPVSNAPLSRVSAAGGQPQALTRLGDGELSHRWPQALPAGKAVLFTIWNDTGFENGRIAVQSMATGQRTILLHGGGDARYVPGSGGKGYVVYARAVGLMAAPFDPDRLEITGPSVPVLEGVVTNLSGGAHYSFSSGGALVYLAGTLGEAERTLVWVDRQGAAQVVAEIRGLSLQFRLSPDERHLVRHTTYGPGRELWLHDLAGKTSTRFTFGGNNLGGVWTPDGKRIAYVSGLPMANLHWKAADGTGAPERLATSPNYQFARCWTPDGKLLVYEETSPNQGTDIRVLSLADRTSRAFVETPYSEKSAALSPDGRWLAYSSNETGRFEVYVQPFPAGGSKTQISTDGGDDPVWAKDGRELYFRDFGRPEAMMAARVAAGADFAAGKPQILFRGTYDGEYDVARDGRFLMMKGFEQESAPSQIHLVLNWFDDLSQRSGGK